MGDSDDRHCSVCGELIDSEGREIAGLLFCSFDCFMSRLIEHRSGQRPADDHELDPRHDS